MAKFGKTGKIGKSTSSGKADKTSLPRFVSKPAALSAGTGVANTKIRQVVPTFISAPGEKIVSGVDSYVVFGRDRGPKDGGVAPRSSGYGGLGHTDCAAIDIVVGRVSAEQEKIKNQKESVWVDSNFKTDAARIYISQKADIDDYFSCAKGSIGNIKARSAIAIKADEIRHVARGGIKIISDAGRTDGKNSRGGKTSSSRIKGINLIAGNDSKDLEPLVKGDKLVKLLTKIVSNMSILNSVCLDLLASQAVLDVILATHTHPVVGMAGFIPVVGYTIPSPETAVGGGIKVAKQMSTGLTSLIIKKLIY